MTTDDYRWLPMNTYDYRWLPMTTDDYRWPPMTTDDYRGLPITAYDFQWLSKTIKDYRKDYRNDYQKGYPMTIRWLFDDYPMTIRSLSDDYIYNFWFPGAFVHLIWSFFGSLLYERKRENAFTWWKPHKSVNNNKKHCQRHNGPEGWVLFTKVQTSSKANLYQISSLEYQPSANLKIAMK